MAEKNINDFDRVVAIGGGHSMGRVLSSLSFLGSRLTGIVTTTDDGGSTGRLQKPECIAWGSAQLPQPVGDHPSIGSQLFRAPLYRPRRAGGPQPRQPDAAGPRQLCVRPWMPSGSSATCWKLEPNLLPMRPSIPPIWCAHTVCGDRDPGGGLPSISSPRRHGPEPETGRARHARSGRGAEPDRPT